MAGLKSSIALFFSAKSIVAQSLSKWSCIWSRYSTTQHLNENMTMQCMSAATNTSKRVMTYICQKFRSLASRSMPLLVSHCRISSINVELCNGISLCIQCLVRHGKMYWSAGSGDRFKQLAACLTTTIWDVLDMRDVMEYHAILVICTRRCIVTGMCSILGCSPAHPCQAVICWPSEPHS